MDNSQLLQAIKEHLDQRVDEVRLDLKEVASRQQGHEIRIDRLEGMAGIIKVTVVTVMGAIGTFIAYVSYKMIDFIAGKQ